MSRLIRMDHRPATPRSRSGPRRTARRCSRPLDGIPSAARCGLLRRDLTRRGSRRAGPRAAARRAAGDPSPAHRRWLTPARRSPAPQRARASCPSWQRSTWRPRATARSLARTGQLWTLSTVSQTVPFVHHRGPARRAQADHPSGERDPARPCLDHSRALRGPGGECREPRSAPARAAPQAEQRAMLLLGDLIGHDARALYERTGLVSERGELGVWLRRAGGSAAGRHRGRPARLLPVRQGHRPRAARGRSRRSPAAGLCAPTSPGFATLANLAFSGARWRMRRRLQAPAREALDHAVARRGQPRGPTALRMFIPAGQCGP